MAQDKLEVLDYLRGGQLPPVRVKIDEKNLLQIAATLIVVFVICSGIYAVFIRK